MAFSKIEINTNEWTLIGDDVTEITFQNASSFPIYINFNSSNTAPTDTVGIVYGPFSGELKKTIADMTLISSPTFVFARSMSKPSSVIVETA